MKILHRLHIPRSKRVQTYTLLCNGNIEVTLTKDQKTVISYNHFELLKDRIMKAQYDKTINGYYVHVKQDDGKYTTLTSFLSDGFDGEVDHKSRDTLDNTISNLRISTKQQQMFNQNRCCGGKIIYATTLRGVTKRKDSGKYRARAQRKDGSQCNIGHFNDELSAALAWDQFMYNEYKEDNPLEGMIFNGIKGEPTVNFIAFNFPDLLPI